MIDLERIMMEVQLEHRDTLTEIGRKRAKRGTTGVNHFIFFCEYEPCGREFHREKRGYKYCSIACHNKAQTTDKVRILSYAKAGSTAKYACERLGMTRSTFRRLLRQYGLYRTWQLARYQKCSPKAGAIQSTARLNDRTVSALSATAGPSQR